MSLDVFQQALLRQLFRTYVRVTSLSMAVEPWTVRQSLMICTASFSAIGRFRRFLTAASLQRRARPDDTMHVARLYTGHQLLVRNVLNVQRLAFRNFTGPIRRTGFPSSPSNAASS